MYGRSDWQKIDNKRHRTDQALDEYSYKRALAVYSLWNQNGIDLRKYGVEVLICGSGMNGMDRDPIEENNKRFIIQIIPKISKPEQ